MDFAQKASYTMADLLAIVALLRDPEKGCPWDKVQTHDTIRMNFIEETYEAVDAIDAGDMPALKEELGDILLQIALHTQMEAERQVFSFDDVCDGICKKLIYRHPHVFGEVQADTAEQVLSNWNDLKKIEKNQTTLASELDAVPKAFPALMRAQKLQKRAGKAGLDYQDAAGAARDLAREVDEYFAAKTPQEQAEEIGDVLFSAVNVARKLGLDAELALTQSADKFAARAKRVEQLAQTGDFRPLGEQKLDEYWREAKKCSL